MTTDELKYRLEAMIQSDGSGHGTGELAGDYELVEELKTSGAGLEAVVEILRCMEANPNADFGTPGPLVHFVERFFKKGYEDELAKSLARQPTSHTVWMLNRLINGTKDATERARLIGVLKAAREHPSANQETQDSVIEFLNRLVS